MSTAKTHGKRVYAACPRGAGPGGSSASAAEAAIASNLACSASKAAAGQVIDEYVSYLGCGVASLVNIFQPEVFCIGGGPSAQGETLMAPVRYILNREDYARNQVHRTRLVRAQLGNDAGLIGAALRPKFR